jgi:DNA repair photolyase
MKRFNGKAIYSPSGKAGEYSYWACNFYVGCSNGCTYCYCKKGILKPVMGMDKPRLKKCFKNENDLEVIFRTELFKNIEELRKHGLFFSFTTDPCLSETIDQTIYAVRLCVNNGIPVKILTKKADILMKNLDRFWFYSKKSDALNLIAFGFTLTGHDDLETGASTNTERIEAMRRLHDARFKTWASIEPIIDLPTSFKMICDTNCICDLYKIGLESGKKYDKKELNKFISGVIEQVKFSEAKVYFKDSLLKAAGINRADLPENCVSRDYNIFEP